jgi:hypothetical protein
VRKADNVPPSCADVKKSGSLNLLEPCGPIQACNGTALPLPFTLYNIISNIASVESIFCSALLGSWQLCLVMLLDSR